MDVVAVDLDHGTRARVRSWTAPSRWVAGQLLSVPVYAVYEAFVRATNRRPRPMRPALRDAVCADVGDIDLDAVRVVEDARIVTGHAGVTFGHTIFVGRTLDPRQVADVDLLVHELAHVRQAVRWGRWGMAQRYGVGWVMALSYRRHPLEVEARGAAAAACARRVRTADQGV